MVAPAGDVGPLRAIFARWPQAHRDARLTDEARDAPHEHHRAEHPPELLEAGCKVNDLDGPAIRVVQPGHEDGSVGEILLLRARLLVECHAELTRVILAWGVAQERAEHRIPIEARKAAPHNVSGRVDQRADGSVADEREVE